MLALCVIRDILDRFKGKVLDKRISFSRKTNEFISVMFGLAFVLIYIASVLLYYVTAQTMELFYVKIFVLFLIYLALYLVCVLVVSSKISQMFAPLDRLYRGLVRDDVRIYGDSEDFEDFAKEIRSELNIKEHLERKLDETQENLDDACRISDEQASFISERMFSCKTDVSKALRSVDTIRQTNNNIKLICDELRPVQTSIKNRQASLNSEKEEVSNGIRQTVTLLSDEKIDMEQLKESYELLIDMLNDSANNLDQLFSDVQSISASCAQTNLFVLTAKLEVTRSGAFNLGVSNSLDDLDNMTRNIIEKTDAFSMYIIKAKNSIKLALDQAIFCKEQADDSINGFSHLSDSMNISEKQINEIFEYVGVVNDNVVKFSDRFNDVIKCTSNIDDMSDKTDAVLSEVKDKLSNDF